MAKKKQDKKINTSIEDDIQTEKINHDTDLSRVSELLLNDRYKRRKTILGLRQVSKLTTIDVISQLYDIEFLKNWVTNYAEWRTSGGGQGRQDIVDITKFSYKQQKEFQSELLTMLGRNK